jgi:hypothetical protein
MTRISMAIPATDWWCVEATHSPVDRPAPHVVRLDMPRRGSERIDEMLDLQSVPAHEHWSRISAAIHRLDQARGRRWRLKLLLRDGPESAAELPPLVARMTEAGLYFDSVREPGGIQGTVLAPREATDLPIAA